jgi:hypothetical protein
MPGGGEGCRQQQARKRTGAGHQGFRAWISGQVGVVGEGAEHGGFDRGDLAAGSPRREDVRQLVEQQGRQRAGDDRCGGQIPVQTVVGRP